MNNLTYEIEISNRDTFHWQIAVWYGRECMMTHAMTYRSAVKRANKIVDSHKINLLSVSERPLVLVCANVLKVGEK
jgi:hypothetical protein